MRQARFAASAFVLEQLDVQDSISWVSFVQPAEGYADDHARFFCAALSILLANGGRCPSCAADINGDDGDVAFDDLVTLLASWSPANP